MADDALKAWMLMKKLLTIDVRVFFMLYMLNITR